MLGTPDALPTRTVARSDRVGNAIDRRVKAANVGALLPTRQGYDSAYSKISATFPSSVSRP